MKSKSGWGWGCLALSMVACDCGRPVVEASTRPRVREATFAASTLPTLHAEGVTSETVLPFERNCIDADRDGFGQGPDCLGADCDDFDARLKSEGTRRCYTGPPLTSEVGTCQAGTQTCQQGVLSECLLEVLPNLETCDGVDNDCDGQIDESLTRACYDGPEGTQGLGMCVAGISTCEAGVFGACVGQVTPTEEVCDDADNNCDGTIDEFLSRACYDGPLGSDNVGICRAGVSTCVAGVYGACEGQVTPLPEVCDNEDNNCDGTIDEFLSRSCYEGPLVSNNVGACRDGVSTCVAGVYGACQGQVTPLSETCDGVDNNCDGQVDESLTRACYDGPEGTENVGICVAGVSVCENGVFGSCAKEKLPAQEVCDGVDNNCNGQKDENLTRLSRTGIDQQSEYRFKPLDVIFVIDNSGSMTDEIVSVENNINNHFANMMEQSGLDYRVIVLSKFGTSTKDQSVCFRPPLGGTSFCSGCPVNTSKFFHYSVEISSTNSLSQVLDMYKKADVCGLAPKGWSAWLRPEALKIFIEITDDKSALLAPDFDSKLLALTPTMFGSAEGRNYIFHSIVGLHENSPRLSPWLPAQSLVSSTCTANGGRVQNNGLEYQKLSMLTGGLRYPLCEYQSFDSVFSQVAEGIISSVQIACDFEVAVLPEGTSWSSTSMEFIPSAGGGTTLVPQVPDAAACFGVGFFVKGNHVNLCPQTCAAWRNDVAARVDLLFGCAQSSL